MGFSRLQDLSWDQEWMELAAYLSGFICHYTLDRMIHPYVCWAERNWIWSVDGLFVRTTHHAVEMSLDVLFWKERRLSRACKVKPEARRYRQELARQCGRIPSGCLCNHISRQDRPEGSCQGAQGFLQGHDLLYDPRGRKGWWAGLIPLPGRIRPPKVPYPARLDETVDWANKKRRTWTHPFKGDEKHRESVDEILAGLPLKPPTI